MMNGGGTFLDRLGRLAAEAGATWIAEQAEDLNERLAEGRFYVVCVGQFKRGKSTLLNALVGVPVLPTGVVPITTAVTVVRHGDRLAARVRFRNREWEECEPGALATYVSEEHNPGNEKGVVGVEVFAPSVLLRSGMCLVDTPGIGSVSLANTEATRAFVPHVDAALVVLGADPPITRDELTLVNEVAESVRDIIVLFNKADRLSDADRREAMYFTRRVLEEALDRQVDPILEVSAIERTVPDAPPRDWDRLIQRLETLARDSRADLVRAAQARETRMLVSALLRELNEQRRALLRPIEQSEARVAQINAAVTDAERALTDLGHLLTAEQERLGHLFTDEGDRFLGRALPAAQQDLVARIRSEPRGQQRRERALDHAREIMRQWLERWRREHEPQADALYREAEHRFVELANSFQDRLATVPALAAVPRLEVHPGFRVKSRFYHTDLMHIAPVSPGTSLLDNLFPWRRSQRVERAALEYLERLLQVNTARMKNDFEDRVTESRRQLEAEIRAQLRRLLQSAERGLEAAREVHAAGARAVAEKLEWLDRLLDRTTKLEADRAATYARGSPFA